MTHRSFQDRDGSRWDVWDVYPGFPERRANSRRQGTAQDGRLVERRKGPDRRQRRISRALSGTSYDAGWLCFESGSDRRRHAPVPADWIAWDDAALEACCRAAARVIRRAVG